MTKDEALKLALEALERNDYLGYQANQKAIAAIKEALAQPGQQPVAFYVYKPTLPRGNLGNVLDGDLPWVYDQDPSSGYSARMLVYTTPPQPEPVIDKSAATRIATSLGWEPKRKPLTDEEIMEVYNEPRSDAEMIAFARAIEAAHGIGEQK